MKERIWMVVLLLIITSISSGALGVINIKTRPLIEKNKVLKLKESVLNALHIPYQHKNMEGVFEEEVKTLFLEDIPLYLHYPNQGKLEAVAFKIEGSGFWAPISAIIALKPDLETIYGVAVLEQGETPGLGARITEPGFLNRFVGKKIKPEILLVSRRKAKGDNEVDAITGATMTSKSLEEIINNEVKKYRDAIIASKIMGETTHES
ncbi:MAG: FMN-binding protein [bacterium]